MRIYLAACEDRTILKMLPQGLGVESGFFSYYYLRGKPNAIMREARKWVKNITIDSGAHSFFAEQGTGLAAAHIGKKSITKETPEEYMRAYLKWIKDNYDYFDNYVELDIGELVGQDKVLEWREQLKATGVYGKCITVYHPRVMSWQDFVDMVDENEAHYIAMEGIRKEQTPIPYGKFIMYCYDRGIRVHGFAQTNRKIAEKYPYFSVDSSSWKMGMRWGQTKSNLYPPGYTSMLARKEIGRFMTLKGECDYFKRWGIELGHLWRKRGIDWDKKIIEMGHERLDGNV